MMLEEQTAASAAAETEKSESLFDSIAGLQEHFYSRIENFLRLGLVFCNQREK